MKLIQQCKLYFKAGTSDKVYEIDLCELSENEYVVNFRYGRRGSTLKEGTKTPAAVIRIEADKIFSDLENEKRKKGYQTEIETFIEIPSLHAIDPDTKEGVILQRLQDGIEGKNSFKTEWKVSKVIKKAGDIQLKEAIPFIIRLLNKGDEFQVYESIRALVKLGAGEAEPIFRSFASQPKQKAHIRNMAYEGLLSILSGEELNKCTNEILTKLPEDVRVAIQKQDKQTLINSLVTYSGKEYVDFFINLYLVSKVYPEIIPPIHTAIRGWSCTKPYFRQMRGIYRLAEVRKDYQTLAHLSYRMEKASGVTRRDFNRGKEEPTFAFAWQTKRHFQKNAVLRLQETGKNLGAKEYLRLAVATLLQYTEADYTPRKESPTSSYSFLDFWKRKRYFILIDRPECHASLLLSTILFGNDPKRILKSDMLYMYGQRTVYTKKYYYDPQEVTSAIPADETNSRQEPAPSVFGFIKTLFGKKKQVEPETVVPAAETIQEEQPEVIQEEPPKILPRFELFPEHWNTMPEAYIQLLLQAKMNIIHQFAYNNLKLRSDFGELCERFQDKELLLLIESDFEAPQKLGGEILQKRTSLLEKQISFISKALNSKSVSARQWARNIVEKNSNYYLDDLDFITGLLFNIHQENDAWIRNLLRNARFTPEREDALLGKTVMTLLELQNTEKNNLLAKAAIERLQSIVGSQFNRISWEMVEQLILSPLINNILLASHITLEKSARSISGEIPVSLTELFLQNSLPEVRINGIEIVKRYPDHFLANNATFLLNQTENPWQEVVENVLKRLQKLVVYNSTLRTTVTRHLVYVLMRKEKFEGAHTLIREFLTKELKSYWNNALSPRDITKLVHSQYRQSQLMGYEILTAYSKLQDFTLGQIISFGNHELLAVRQWCWNYFQQNISRIRFEKLKAFSLLDSNWDDTRAYAFQFFRTQFTEQDWDTESLIYITDSIRPDVESFGKELITRYFKAEEAPEYLSKLSEHPGIHIQELITFYLSTHAAGKTEVIRELDFYFRSILTRVNKARIAKKRVFEFLHREALKSVEAAEIIVPVLDYVSAQSTIQDKETSIRILKEIKELYPHLDMHLTIKN